MSESTQSFSYSIHISYVYSQTQSVNWYRFLYTAEYRNTSFNAGKNAPPKKIFFYIYIYINPHKYHLFSIGICHTRILKSNMTYNAAIFPMQSLLPKEFPFFSDQNTSRDPFKILKCTKVCPGGYVSVFKCTKTNKPWKTFKYTQKGNTFKIVNLTMNKCAKTACNTCMFTYFSAPLQFTFQPQALWTKTISVCRDSATNAF